MCISITFFQTNFYTNGQFCLYDVKCGDTHEKWTATRIQNTSNSDYDPVSYHHTYNAIISYDCGLGKRFNEGGNYIRNVDYICDKRASGAKEVEVKNIFIIMRIIELRIVITNAAGILAKLPSSND